MKRIKNRNAITIETYNKSAVQYQDKFMNFDLYNDTFDKFCNLLEAHGANIFEIGCGPGNVTKYLLSKRPDFNITGIDLSPNMVKLSKMNNPTANFIEMDCRKIGELTEKYDAVLCAFCLPYLSKIESKELIEKVSELLVAGGIFYLSTMEDDYDKSGFETTSFSGKDEVYIYYHEFDYLSKILFKNNFEIVAFQKKNYPDANRILTDMIFIARKL